MPGLFIYADAIGRCYNLFAASSGATTWRTFETEHHAELL
jgi:hypothetical protein